MMEIVKIFNILVDSYPENINLDTIEYYQIFDYVKFIENIKTQYAYNVLMFARIKFEEFLNNESYLFDLDKNSKELLGKIERYLNNLNLNFSAMDKELENSKNIPIRFDCALFVIKELKLEKNLDKLIELINTNSLNPHSFKFLIQNLNLYKLN